jgi:2-polyprenyl-6-methoxyphenol hydroxylase-like FAD-dependent oxidoreductase
VPERFDLAIIGSGNAGYIPAIGASQLGMTVAIIEKESVLEGNYGDVRLDALSLIVLASFEGNAWAPQGSVTWPRASIAKRTEPRLLSPGRSYACCVSEKTT